MSVNIIKGGKPNVVLIAGGGKVYTDIAARFVRSEKELEEIIASPYSKKIVQNIINRGHLAATEFDWFVFGVEHIARPTETQMVRKRIASYIVKTGRAEKNGKRSFDVIQPPSIPDNFRVPVQIPGGGDMPYNLSYADLMNVLNQWYDGAVYLGIPEEDARFVKPQATEVKMLIGMNAHALLDWWKIRCCNNAQWEIRALAYEMLRLAREAKPDLFQVAGANCAVLGYCPENEAQCQQMKGKIPTHDQVKEMITQWRST